MDSSNKVSKSPFYVTDCHWQILAIYFKRLKIYFAFGRETSQKIVMAFLCATHYTDCTVESILSIQTLGYVLSLSSSSDAKSNFSCPVSWSFSELDNGTREYFFERDFTWIARTTIRPAIKLAATPNNQWEALIKWPGSTLSFARMPRPSDSLTNSTNGISNILASTEAGIQVLLFQTNPSEQDRQLSGLTSHIWQEAWQRAQRNWFIFEGVWNSVAINEPRDML